MAHSVRKHIVPSVLDRLLDDRPDEVVDPPSDLREEVAQLRRAVARDLESLLNTRRESVDDLDEFPEARRSVLAYGLPDFSTMSLQSDDDRLRIMREVRHTLEFFEPRLHAVRVELEISNERSQNLGFRIEALLKVDPVLEPVVFDALLQMSTQRYAVT